MHKHKRYKHGYFPVGMIWWVIFAMMFMQGEWRPWLLIAGGCWFVFGSMFDEEKPKPEKKNPPPVSDFDSAPPPIVTKPIVNSTEPIHNAALLPATCSQCGAPVSLYEVKWKGAYAAACPYCGSHLKMKNNYI